MSGYLSAADEDGAVGDAADLYEQDRRRDGQVRNYTKTFAARPQVYRAWQALNGAVKSGMELRRYEVATVAAARELRSSYCALAHGSVLAGIIGEEGVRELVDDGDAGLLSETDRAVAELATKIAADASSITEADYERLRSLGFTDADILDVVLATAARCFFSTVLDATGTLPDSSYGSALSAPTVAALTVGRPIDDAAAG